MKAVLGAEELVKEETELFPRRGESLSTQGSLGTESFERQEGWEDDPLTPKHLNILP